MQHDSNEPGIGEGAAAPLSSDRLWLEVALLSGASDDARETDATPGGDRDPRGVAMVVAQDLDLRTYIRDCLSASGLRILDAADLAAAAAALRGHTLDLLIVDLPDGEPGPGRGDAWPMGAFPSVPLVLITDEPPGPGLVEWAAGGRAALVVKPFNARRLQEKVARCLGTRPVAGDERGGSR